jgi:hypothetical protein
MGASYDDAEAVDLLRARSGREALAQQIDAAKTLLEQFEATAKKAGWLSEWQRFSHLQRALWVSPFRGKDGVFVLANDDGVPVICFADHSNAAAIEGIRFDAQEARFVGAELDTYYTPEPGQPRKKRSPLAALAAAVISYVDKQPS